MAFGIGTKTKGTNARGIRGEQIEIACECWFKSNGDATPLMFKFKDEMEEVHTVREITVHSKEKKNYSGIPTIEYRVTIAYQGICKDAKMVFFIDECKWVLNCY